MKKTVLLFAIIFIVTSAFAFEKGTINPGGTASVKLTKDNSDSGTLTTISIHPQLGYLVVDNLSLDAMVIFESQSMSGDVISSLGLGVGGRYFFNRIYGGLDFEFTSSTIDIDFIDNNITAMYLQPKLGVLFPLGEKVFVDLNAAYKLGIGNYGGDSDDSNESSELSFNLGLQYFLKR
jgi:hypothetical protein|nr:hypothetical protein [Candidatus Cloacimonadota bacterium]